MINWIKKYFSRQDTRIGFFKEDVKLNLIGAGIVLVLYVGYGIALDLKDRMEKNNSLIINEKLRNYCEREVED